MNEYGLGTPQDFKAAAKSYRRSASKQDPRAIYYLALMHAYGRGMDQDFQQAMILFKEAAEMGQVGAQLMLANFTCTGMESLSIMIWLTTGLRSPRPAKTRAQPRRSRPATSSASC